MSAPRPSAAPAGDPSAPLLDEAHAAFLCGGVSLVMGTRDRANRPDLVRALGCRVSADRRRVTVIVSAEQAAAALADLRDNRAVALVASQPSTHRTLQLKGFDAAIAAASEQDRILADRYRAALAAELQLIAFGAPFAEALLASDADELLAVSFTPEHAFDQTPGPAAGAPLRPSA